MSYNNNIVIIIQKYKNNPHLTIPITNLSGENIAYFRHVVPSIADAELITEWRKKNRFNFLSQFKETTERTINWIKSELINSKKRALFMIVTPDNIPVGHLGLTNIDPISNGAELDYGCRGRKDLLPGVFELAYGQLPQWCFDELKLQYITGRVFEDNTKPIELLELNKFILTEKIPLKKIIDKDIVRWIEVPKLKTEETEKVLVEYTKYNMNTGITHE